MVAALSLVLMFGRYLPPVARLLHALPSVGLLTAPVRHNFELGIALAVLGAFGFEQARGAGSTRIRGWFIAGLVLAASTAFALWLGGSISDQAGGMLLAGVGWPSALGALLFFALWLRALRGPAAPAAVWLLIAVGPLLETVWAVRNPAARTRDFRALPATAAAALPATRPLRVLSVPAARGNVDTLVGNSGLFQRGVQTINGFSRSVYPDVSNDPGSVGAGPAEGPRRSGLVAASVALRSDTPGAACDRVRLPRAAARLG